ncbi:MAG: pyridoxal phosphate-dependent aminotransferase [Lachnospiraceae bacterium]
MLSKQITKDLSNSSAIRKAFADGQELAKVIGEENVFDFSLGNPATPAPAKFNEAVKNIVDHEDSIQVHGYMDNSGYPDVRQAVAENLNERFKTQFDFSNITMSVGAGGALNTVLKVLLDPGDEVIVFAPFFSEYTHYIGNFYGTKVEVAADTTSFQPNLEDFEKKITEKTKAVIVNTPNNPSGVVYSEEKIQKLAEILSKKQKEFNKEIYLISDEPYRELLYDGAVHHFLTNYYENTFVCYSFSKSLSLPGERIGYVAISNEMADAAMVKRALQTSTRILGFINAPSLIQKAVKECLNEKTDIEYYDKNRRTLYEGLIRLGFECAKPEGAFYIFLKSPEADEIAFCEKAKKYNIMIVNGTSFSCPGYVRLTYCVSLDKIQRSLPQFEKLAKDYGLC